MPKPSGSAKRKKRIAKAKKAESSPYNPVSTEMPNANPTATASTTGGEGKAESKQDLEGSHVQQ